MSFGTQILRFVREPCSEQRISLDATYPRVSTLLIYLVPTFINYFREQIQRRRIRLAFGQYFAPSLVEQPSHE